jgi:hypothetical protein
VQLPEIAVIEKPANHFRWPALSWSSRCRDAELEHSIDAGYRSLEASMEKAAGPDHGYASTDCSPSRAVATPQASTMLRPVSDAGRRGHFPRRGRKKTGTPIQ